MARPPKFAYRNTADGWLVNTPATLSATGKRERCFFSTRDEAKAHAAKLREDFLKHGGNAAAITPSLSSDATKAAALLEKFHITLTQAARFYATHHDKRAKAPTLAKAWEDGLVFRANHRKRTLSDLRKWLKKLPGWFLAMNCFDITAKHISKALNKATKGPTFWQNGLANISAILGDVVLSGAIEKNPAASVVTPRAVEEEDDDVSIYTPDELRALFAACIDYPLGEEDRHCAACSIPFAVMAFAGIRPAEISRLKWDRVSLELKNIQITAGVAKKAFRRNVRIQPTLSAWLETVPANKRKGNIVPPRWLQKAAKVRKKAGIDGREKQDALRHSFGSYLLASENNLDALKNDMGHQHVAVFFEHYRKALTKAQALPYWQILPPGVTLPVIAAEKPATSPETPPDIVT